MGSGFAKKKKEAKHFQSQMMELQKSISHKLDNYEATGSAGNGLVTVVLGGNGEMKRIKINPECVDKDDLDGLEALIKAAHQDASKQIQEIAASTPGFESLSGLGL